jgi:hypothetical protein
MYARYRDAVDFYAIYIREAHPSDGWSMESNDRVGIRVSQPKSTQERTQVATKCCQTLRMSMPLLVDAIDDPVGRAYSGFPDRLYLIDRDGRVAYKGGRGPFGYRPRELEQTLVMMLLDDAQSKIAHDAEAKHEKESANEPTSEPAGR